MSIQLQLDDPVLARMLLLEAKRHGFREEAGASILFIDLDRYPPHRLKDGLTVGLSATPSAHETAHGIPVLSLPFSVLELENILYRLRDMRRSARVERLGERVLLGGEEIELSRTERRLFNLIYDNSPHPVSDADMNAVLGDSTAHTNTLSVYLYRLRRKLCADGVARIRRLRGKGCQWIEK